ncbi:MAG TPA: ABC transporter permease subunit [Virgibacillus sp.]|nr:ABC transporter permease subunit [Virgibacillus sp.]HLR66861.1 ABC transporter permease subunit [Virgibacillus sp.]
MKSIYRKDLIDVWRDRKTLVLSILLPLLIVFVSVSASTIGEDTQPNVVYDSSVPTEVINLIQEENAALEYSDHIQDDLMHNTADIGIQVNESTIAIHGNMDIENIQESIIDLELLIAQANLQDIQHETNTDPWSTQVEDIDQESGSMGNLLMNILIMSVLFGAFPASVSLFAGEKEQRTMESLLMAPRSRLRILSSKFSVVVTLGVISGFIAVSGSVALTSMMDEGESLVLGSQLFGQLLGTIVNAFLYIINLVMVLTIISIMSESFKEAQNYMMAMMLVLFISPGIMMALTPSNIPTWFYIIPSLNTNALMQSIFSSEELLVPFLLTILSSVLSFIILFLICYRVFTDDKKALGNN